MTQLFISTISQTILHNIMVRERRSCGDDGPAKAADPAVASRRRRPVPPATARPVLGRDLADVDGDAAVVAITTATV